MGFFSEIVSETRQSQLRQPTRQTPMTPAPSAPEAKPSPAPEPPVETMPAPAPAMSADSPRPGTPAQTVDQTAPAPQPEPKPEQQPKPEPEQKPEPPEQPPAIDLTPEAGAPDDDAKRKAHEAAEAKRKAEWDAKQAKKKAARQAALDKIAAMNAAELLAEAVKRVASDTERLTRRNMKEAVAEHIQAKCREDASFAMLAMDPDKSMVNCFKYINRQAQAYAEQEIKDQGIQRTGVYGLDVPDGLCYKWAEDYFNDPDAKEDHVDEEKFIPKPYVPASAPRKAPKAKGKAEKKQEAAKPKAEKPTPEKPKDGAVMEQMSLM